MMTERRLKILRNMPIFGGIEDGHLEFLLEDAPTVRVAAGDYFFREDELGGDIYVLETGRVEVVKTWNGKAYHLRVLGPGECFGEMSMIDMRHRSASVLAMEDCAAILLSRAGILQLYRRDLEQFVLIQMNMGREVSRRLRLTNEQLFEELVQANKIREHRHSATSA